MTNIPQTLLATFSRRTVAEQTVLQLEQQLQDLCSEPLVGCLGLHALDLLGELECRRQHALCVEQLDANAKRESDRAWAKYEDLRLHISCHVLLDMAARQQPETILTILVDILFPEESRKRSRHRMNALDIVRGERTNFERGVFEPSVIAQEVESYCEKCRTITVANSNSWFETPPLPAIQSAVHDGSGRQWIKKVKSRLALVS